jgi:hypothetical protein
MSDDVVRYSPRVLAVPHAPVTLRGGQILRPVALRAPWAEPGIAEWQAFAGLLGLQVIVSSDTGQHGTLLHVSVAYPTHLPTWETVHQVRDAFFPDDVDVAMILPRARDYVNLHPNTLHLTQLPVEWGIQ